MRKIEKIEEIQQIVLQIGVVFAKICEENNIDYFMLGGTMLGAVRHKGFIPWDDDMDLGVPRTQYSKMLDVLERELPAPYKVLTSKDKGYVYNYAKIVDTRTIAIEPCLESSYYAETGIFIDIFPLDYCKENDDVIKKVWDIREKMAEIYIIPSRGFFLKKWLRLIKRTLWPISLTTYLEKADNCIKNEKTEFWANIYGHWREKEIIPIEWYGEDSFYEFAGHKFRGIKEYDKYLTKLYGDYLQLPPENQRQIHIGSVFWK